MKTKIYIKQIENKLQVFVYQNDVIVEQYEEYFDGQRLEGNIYLGKVTDVVKGMQAAFINIGKEKNAFIHVKDIIPKESNITGNENIDITKFNINKLIKRDDNIIVQIKKDCNNNKGPRVTKDIKLTGKYVVLMPYSKFITVSKKIENKEERNRLIKIVKDELEKQKSKFGIIIRTSSEEKDEKVIANDIQNLIYEWNEIIKKSKQKKAPYLLYDNNGIIGKLINDFEPNGIEIYTNSEDVKEFIKNIDKDIEVTIKETIEQEIDKSRKIWLSCGGFITIDETEALVAVDVNSGKFIGKKELEATVLKVNNEAAKEIARQIRLRDLGGIIVIDFIDMENEDDRLKIKEKFEQEIKKDRSKVQIVEFTKLGLLEITRKHILGK